MHMKLGVYTVEKTLFEGDVEKIIARTSTGEVTILNDHIPLLSRLIPSEIAIIAPEQKETRLPIQGGFLEVRPGNHAVILAEQKIS